MIKTIRNKYSNLPIQIKASFWFFICTFSTKAITVLTTPLFTRLLTTSEYGEYSVYTSWLGIFTVFISLNLSLGVFMRGLIKFKENKEQFAASMQALTFIMVVVWICIYLPFYNNINKWTGLNTVRTVLMIITIWLTAVFGFWAAEQRVDYQYRKLVPLSITVSFLGQGLGIILIQFLEDRVSARIAGTVIINCIFYIWLFGKDLKKGKTIINLEFWKYALAFNIPLIPHYLSQTILNSSDRIMIDRMEGSGAAGIYGLAYSLAQVMMMFNTALVQTEEPWMYRKIEENKIEDIKSIAYTSFAFIAIVNIFLIALAPEIIAIFAPKEYYDAIWVIPPVVMSVFFSFSYYFFAIFEYYFERTKTIAIASCFGAILNIILNYLLIPIFGYFAAGYTTLVCFIIYAVLHYTFMRKICKEKLEGREPFSVKVYIIIAAIFMAFGFVFQMTYSNILVRYSLLLAFLIGILLKRKLLLSKVKMLIKVRKK